MRFLLFVLAFLNCIPLAMAEDIPLEVLNTQQKHLEPSHELKVPKRSPLLLQEKAPLILSPEIPRPRHSFITGSLKENITHLARQFGWSTVVWHLPYDYQWVGKTNFHEKNLKCILQNVLSHFPLQAVFYEGNHVLVIEPRNIS